MPNAVDARSALLEGFFDHAPLFPPASLPLEEARREDERARQGPFAFALGRLVWPASRLHELATVERRLSVVLDAAAEPDPRIEAVEVPPGGDVELAASLADEVYVEVVLDASLEEKLDRLSAHGVRAKVRCGGAATPSVAELARALGALRERGIVCKATAGLHHAVRRDGEHGFLNLLAACVFGDEEDALGETERSAFSLDEATFSWRDRAAPAAALARARCERLHSIGTCSFSEPIEELEALGILPP